MRFLYLFVLLCTIVSVTHAQNPKREINAVKTTLPIKIDGDLNDVAWRSAAVASNFIEQRPNFGRPNEDRIKSEAYILYDNTAVYVAGFCREQSPDSISTELIGRDRVGVNDFAGVMFDTYLDEINGVGFYVTALGEQFDTKYSLNNEDGSWSTVYQTATKITDSGWTYEMMIPYSALRFSKEEVQSWGINFVRRRVKTGQQFVWSPLNPLKFGTMNQAGVWKDIRDIKPPLRLSFSPYFSTYLNGIPNNRGGKTWNTTVNGGMDVKYGISKSFTLDMTLIPDFGQVQSDNQVLNLSPFEVRFNENRSFFTEGTELFNKGNLFYSRRIGGVPVNYSKAYNGLLANETVLRNPSETKLFNATKISGRTAKGLGVGFFNAVTKPQYATIENNLKQQREVETSPLTNYNIIALDQTLKNNSSVFFINTNVLRNGNDYDANVSAAMWDFYDKNVNWNFWGKIANSNLFDHPTSPKTISGFNYEVNLGQFKGPFNFYVSRYLADEKYQQNDMGYFTNNNYVNHGASFWYKFNKPRSFYNNLTFALHNTYSQRYLPRDYQFFSSNFNVNSQLKNLWNTSFVININPAQQDFYEPRIAGKMFKTPSSFRTGFSLGSNSAKRYSASIQFYERILRRYKANTTEVYFNNQYRFNEKFTLGMNTYTEFANKNLGFAYINPGAETKIIFGLRDRHTVENIFNLKYNFNIKMGLTFRARHYWSKVDYKRFFTLKDDGYLQDAASVTRDPNQNLNLFNIDMVYTWQFGPGSFINVGWKNTGELYNQNVLDKYYNNLDKTLSTPQLNNFSIKVIYFLDYLSLKKKG